MNTVKIRPYEETDRKMVADWIIGIQEIERSYLWTHVPGKDMVEKYFAQTAKEVADNNGAWLIAEINGKPAGFVSFFAERANDVILSDEANFYGYITDMYVSTDFHGKGVYQALLAKAIESFKKLGVTSVRLNVVAQNERARAAYEKEGFVAEEIEMRKRI